MVEVKKLKEKTLLISIYHAFIIDKNDYVFFKEQHGRYIDGIAPYFKKVYILSDKIRHGDSSLSFLDKKLYFDVNGESTFYRYTFKNSNIVNVMLPRTQKGIFSNLFKGIYKTCVFLLYGCKSDVIYIFGPSLRSIPAVLVASLLKKKLVLYVSNEWREHSQKYTLSSWKRKMMGIALKISEQIIVKKSSLILTTSNGLMDAYRDYNNNVKKVVPLTLYDKNDIVTHKMFDKGVMRLITVAHIRREKRLMDILKATVLLKERHIPFKLSVVGSIADAQYYQEIISFINREGISDSIVFHGLVTDKNVLANIYINNDVFILTSEFEGFPKVVYEAIIHKNIVVVSDIPAYKNFGDGKIYKVPLGDYEKLSNIFIEIYHIPEKKLKEISTKALEEINFIFDSTPVNQFVEETDVLYK